MEGDSPGPDSGKKGEGRPHRSHNVAGHAKQQQLRLGRVVVPNWNEYTFRECQAENVSEVQTIGCLTEAVHEGYATSATEDMSGAHRATQTTQPVHGGP
jgi:hypothetical protein